MVLLYVSLLAVALATGPAMALPNEHQQRSELDSDLYRREFVDNQDIPFTREDHEDLYIRDDLEAREPFGLDFLFKAGARGVEKAVSRSTAKRAAEHAARGGQSNNQNQNQGGHHRHRRDLEELYGRDAADYLRKRSHYGAAAHVRTGLHYAHRADQVRQTYNDVRSRGLEHNEELFGRNLEDEELYVRGHKHSKHAAKRVNLKQKKGHHHRHHRRDLGELYSRDFPDSLQKRSGYGRVAHGVDRSLHYIHRADQAHQAYTDFQSRSLEHNEELLGRDLDAEKLYGREYAHFDERDIFDDLD